MARKPPTPDQLKRRAELAFARRIQNTFKNAGFTYLPTKDMSRKFGNKTGELDAVFLYENVVLISEDTTSTKAREHLKNKKILFDEIDANHAELVDWLKATFPEKFSQFDDYDVSRYKVFFLYFSKDKITLTEDDKKLFAPVIVVEPSTLNYFDKMSRNIKFSSRTDIYRYLGLKSKDVGTYDSGAPQKRIETSIIYPSDNTGLQNDVRLVSFMISAGTLLRNSFVLRKDNWEDSIELYQRLIEKNRIQNIRKHLATKKTTFFNNIIVTLPPGVVFEDAKGVPVTLDKAQSFDGHRMLIPDEFNSIAVIDGQHRIFAHYEGNDGYEAVIGKIREKFHLLVTGLIFPSSMTQLDRRKFESEIFLDINSNSRPVPQDVLLFIQTLKEPFSDRGVARQVLARLNNLSTFENTFQLTLMEDSRIKIASIVKFALRYLVEITNESERSSVFTSWAGKDKARAKLIEGKDEALLKEYVNWSASQLDMHFSALKATFGTAWGDDQSKILSTTSINAFLMALRRSLPTYGLRDFDFYREVFGRLSLDFSKDKFGHTSSQYNRLSKVILSDGYELKEVDGGWVPK